MALQIRAMTDDIARAMVASLNAMRRDSVVVGSRFHADVTSTTTGTVQYPTVTALAVSAANATNEATLVTLCEAIRSVYALHLADALGHKVADTANAIAAATVTNTATAITFLNEVKADYNLHGASTTYHYTADATNVVSSANATDEASAITLANEIKTDLNAHILSAPAGYSIQLIGP